MTPFADLPPTGPFGILRPANEAIAIAILVAGVALLGLGVARWVRGKSPPEQRR